MRIAIITDCFMPTKNGVVTVVSQLSSELTRMGHMIIVISPGPKHISLEELDLKYHVEWIPSIQASLKTKQPLYLGIVKEKKIRELLRLHEINIVHTHTEFSLGHAGLKAAQALGIPSVHTLHTMWEQYRERYGLLRHLLPRGIIRHWVRRILTSASVIATPSKKGQQYIQETIAGIDPVVIPNGVEDDPIDENVYLSESVIRTQIGLSEDDYVLLFVGRISKEKSIIELLYALAPYLQCNQHAKLVLVGNGPEQERLHKLSFKLGVGCQVLFTGFIEPKLVRNYYRIAHLFVTWSITEVHSMSVIEALRAGLPVICRKDSSFEDLVLDQLTGFQVKDKDDFQHILNKLTNDSQLRQRLSDGARQWANQFSMVSHAQNYEALFASLLEKST